MLRKLKVEGFTQFEKTLSELEQEKPERLFILFSGSKDSTGNSWCPDCVAAEPVIEEALEKVSDDAVFLYVGVGDRPFWKDPNCVFRTDRRTQLTCVPTLIKWGTRQRLLDDQCNKSDMVSMLFED